MDGVQNILKIVIGEIWQVNIHFKKVRKIKIMTIVRIASI
jgi:hypothetical protein